MGTVLRLHKEADNNIKDWVGGTHKAYGADVIEQIEDPGGARADKEITSIPSPFARIDLACNAFKTVADSKDLNGNTIWHKLVSDCLDVGEIFFNYDKLADKLEILVWDKDRELRKLSDSKVEAHRILSATLRMYLEQDAQSYNFDRMDKIFMLRYKGKGKISDLDIIGATSPRTLFFSSANNLCYCADQLRLGTKDRVFDSDYTPLYERDFQFQKYLYSWRIAYGEQRFASDFPEFNAYLQESLCHLDDDQKDELEKLDDNSLAAFRELQVDGNTVEILDFPMRKANALAADEMKSDFFIDSRIYDGRRPLVLPVTKGNTYSDLRYIRDNWQDDNQAPFFCYDDMEERTLPFTADKYPYLTIGDFLTPSVIRMPYQLSDSFFNGNLINDKTCSFLLPLKDTFFKYFTPKDLMEPLADGKNMIDMAFYGNGLLEVKLRIPIQKGRYVEYERKYKKADCDVSEKDNEGRIIERKFGLGILPAFDFSKSAASAFYRVAFFNKNRNGKLSFAGAGAVKEKHHSVRKPFDVTCSVESYVLEQDFNRIFIEIDKVRNVAVPIMKTEGTAAQYSFAVDFGTTNTHIEYSVDGRASKAFDMSPGESQICRMHSDYQADKDIEAAFLDSFIPNTIGAADDYAFPIRTVLAESTKIDYRTPQYSLADGNIPFRYEKTECPKYNRIVSDLKWSNDDAGRVEMYLDNLFLLMRNKVILGGGGLEKTKIVWFYPVSMTRARCNRFSEIWKRLYLKYFGEKVDDNLVMINESVAPYHYFKKELGAKSNVVSIDIGGGTTDVYVVEDKPVLLSSFRFAANSIFGDGYNFPARDNGFVNTFKSDIESCLGANKLEDLKTALNSIAETETKTYSTDIVAFFFSLASNRKLIREEIPVDFLEMLCKNDKLKYAFIVFYGAILFYVATMMKAKGLALPQTIAFSGNGSKTLRVLSSDKKTLAKYVRLIFEKVYGSKYENTSIDIIYENEPKLATCKGGIVCKENLSYDDVDELKTSLLGMDNSSFTDGWRYDSISDEQIAAVAENVSLFIDELFDINDDNKNFFIDSFGADAGVIKTVKTICKEDLVEFTKQGLNKRREELKAEGSGEDAEIEETMFFYPIVAMLSNLARKI